MATLRNSTYCIGSLSHAWTPTMILPIIVIGMMEVKRRKGGRGDSKVVLFIGQSCFAIAFE